MHAVDDYGKGSHVIYEWVSDHLRTDSHEVTHDHHKHSASLEEVRLLILRLLCSCHPSVQMPPSLANMWHAFTSGEQQLSIRRRETCIGQVREERIDYNRKFGMDHVDKSEL